ADKSHCWWWDSRPAPAVAGGSLFTIDTRTPARARGVTVAYGRLHGEEESDGAAAIHDRFARRQRRPGAGADPPERRGRLVQQSDIAAHPGHALSQRAGGGAKPILVADTDAEPVLLARLAECATSGPRRVAGDGCGGQHRGDAVQPRRPIAPRRF